MPFIFANFSALWLLPAIAAPVIFHLFFRLRKQLHDFPTLMFFLRIDPRLSAKRKLHEWLILLLRTLLIAAIIFALARPSAGLINQQNGVAKLILIDNSGSMSEPTQPGVTKLRFACQCAETMLAATHDGDSVAVQLTIPDPGSELPEAFGVSNPEAIRAALEKVTPTDAAPSIPRALRRAMSALKNAKQPISEIHIITDLQSKNWSQTELGALGGQARIVVHRIDTEDLHGGAASLEITDAPVRSIPAGRITPVRFALINHAKETAHVRLNATDDGAKSFTQELTLNANETSPSTVTFTFANPGFHWARVWLEGDVSPTGTDANIGFLCTDVAKAAFVGDRAQFGLLPDAVAPGGSSDLSGIDTQFIDSAKLSDLLSSSVQPLAVVVVWSNWPDSPVLENYVENGGTLFIVPAPELVPSFSGSLTPGWVDAISLPLAQVPPTGETLLLLHPDNPLWRDLRNDQGQPQFGTLLAFHEKPIKLSASWVPLLASSRGATLLAVKALGKGRIYASGLAFNPAWSGLPLKAGFVVMIQNAFFGRTREQIPVSMIAAGEDVSFDSPSTSVTIRTLSGSSVIYDGSPGQFEGLPRSGIYEITQGQKTKWIATHANSDEAVRDFLPIGNIPLLQTLAPDIVNLKTTTDILIDPRGHPSGTSLFGYLLVASLLLLFLETWVANAGIALFGQTKLKRANERKSHARV